MVRQSLAHVGTGNLHPFDFRFFGRHRGHAALDDVPPFQSKPSEIMWLSVYCHLSNTVCATERLRHKR